MTRRLATAAAVLLAAIACAPAQAVTPRTSLTDVENDVMCPTCHEPLAVAQSLQADRERAYIRKLIAQGLTKAQIEASLVSQFGPGVLGRPPAHGFNLAVYVVPPALVALGLALLAVTLPRWRRRARQAAAGPSPEATSLSAEDARRLDEDLGRFA